MRCLSFHKFPFSEFDRLPVACGSRLAAKELSSDANLSDACQAVVQPSTASGAGYRHFHLVADVENDALDWEDGERRGVNLTRLYETVRRVILCLIEHPAPVRRKLLALRGSHAWRVFESSGAPLR
jgi:hypothetical protein